MMAKNIEKPIQAEMPFEIVQGEELTELPKDLYIPPVALQVFLDAFEGPLLDPNGAVGVDFEGLGVPLGAFGAQFVPKTSPFRGRSYFDDFGDQG